MKKYLVLLLVLTLAVATALLSSCLETPESFTVTLEDGEHFTVDGEHTVTVEKGKNAEFKLVLAEGYAFESSNYGTFDEATGVLTVENVKKDIKLKVYTATGITVTIETGTGVSADKTSINLLQGSDAVFHLTFEEKYAFKSSDRGDYDQTAGTLTIHNVQADVTVHVEAEKMTYDPNEQVFYRFEGSTGDTSSVASNTKQNYGTRITVTAGDMTREFVGWYIKNDTSNIISTDRTFTFTLIPDYVSGTGTAASIRVKPVYKSVNVYYYNANGGKINTASSQIADANKTYVEMDTSSDGILKCTLTSAYTNALACGTVFWSDGTFTRDGYVLKEFNTRADGSGEPYSFGDTFYPCDDENTNFVLYAIWAKVTESDFTYTTYSKPKPTEKEGGKTISWTESGIMITGYKGNDTTVAIPETIGGKPVLWIDKDAFSGKAFTTVILPRTLQIVRDGAFVNCSSLQTVYYPNGLWYMTDAAMDNATRTNFKTLVVYHSIAPRFTTNEQGTWKIKLSRLLSTKNSNRIIAVAGSSSFQGLASEYLTDLLDKDYQIVNIGTTRTTHGSLYLEAMGHYTHEGDIVMFAPENSAFMMGDTTLYYKSVRDLNHMNNLWRYVDISKYSYVFGALRDFAESKSTTNEGCSGLYSSGGGNYEAVAGKVGTSINKYGDDIKVSKAGYVDTSSDKYKEPFLLTFNERFKSANEGDWKTANKQTEWQESKNSEYWVSVNKGTFQAQITRAVASAKKGGAKVYFGFCPVSESAMLADAKNLTWLAAYDNMIKTSFGFDGLIGQSKDYVFAREYFFDNCFHTNNYGRPWRTYQLYKDLCAVLDRDVKYKNGDLGENYQGCLFEKDGGKIVQHPRFTVDLK
ncbi:MAG: leucine-rich repeat domain-containing protein [Clostridia bacterium]|nr:leucine-rich repeat domain-containing protein [Clostridia bacterium]